MNDLTSEIAEIHDHPDPSATTRPSPARPVRLKQIRLQRTLPFTIHDSPFSSHDGLELP